MMIDGVAMDYEGVRELLDARRRHLKLTMLELDHIAGFPTGYSSTLFCGGRNFGPQTLGWLLGALHFGLNGVEVPSALGRNVYAFKNNEIRSLKHDKRIGVYNRIRMKELGSLGGRARKLKLAPLELKKIAMLGVKAKKIKMALDAGKKCKKFLKPKPKGLEAIAKFKEVK